MGRGTRDLLFRATCGLLRLFQRARRFLVPLLPAVPLIANLRQAFFETGGLVRHPPGLGVRLRDVSRGSEAEQGKELEDDGFHQVIRTSGMPELDPEAKRPDTPRR